MEEIKNKDTILNELNNLLNSNSNSNPSVEYLITKPYGLFRLPFGLGSINYNWFGHSALRYTTPDGKDIVVNIEAKEKDKNFIQLYDAKEYLFGITSTQKGIYQRDIVGLRIENVSSLDIQNMHDYILNLKLNNNNFNDKIRFNIILGPILNFLGNFINNFPEYGNCAKWTSSMLFTCGLTTNYFVWTKTIFINMFENYHKTNIKELTNMNVIYYERSENLIKPFYGVKDRPIWFENSVAPFQSIRNYFYGDLKHFAKAIVTIDVENNIAKVKIRQEEQISKPNKLRNVLNSKLFVCTSVITSIIVYKKTFRTIKKYIKNYI
jgi:hypothetical protein